MDELVSCIGILSPGAMGSGLGHLWQGAGLRVVTTLAGRSPRTRRLAAAAGLELLPDLDAVVAASDVVVSVVPPQQAAGNAADVAGACARTGARPLVADVNAVSPQTMAAIAGTLARTGLQTVDGSISGGPPHPGGDTILYLSGPSAAALAPLGADGLRTRVVDDRIGAASAVKMCTASVYKGFSALLAQALLTARANGVEGVVVDDLRTDFPEHVDLLPVLLANAASKAWRYVGEMHQIAETQAAAGAGPELFDAVATVWSTLSGRALAQRDPEQAADVATLAQALDELARPV